MAGVINKTARQYNLKAVKSGKVVTVRIAPGFNVVEDKYWSAFVKGTKVNAYVAKLKSEGKLEFGKKQDDMEIEQDPDTKAKAKEQNLVGDASKKVEPSDGL